MRGFTLIELLMVMLILAMGAVIVVTNAPPQRSDVRTAAERFALGLKLSEERAALLGNPVRIVVEDTQYRFEQYRGSEWMEGTIGRFPSRVTLPADILLSVTSESVVKDNEARLLRPNQEKAKDSAQTIIIDPAGMSASIKAEFSRQGDRWIVEQAATGEVRVGRSAN